jgi:tRNA nucleotidyltransferase (CCA-adding enzyme)
MLLILTHENADFDAVASQLAAFKLFPDGVPLLSRRVNRNVNQFLTLYWDVLPFVRTEDWRRKRVDRVLLVDTHSLNSVRGMVQHPEVKVIDHHVGQELDPGWTYQVEETGATTTLLVELLQGTGLHLVPEEATLLLLGVYEDTGSLTYETTTARDIRAAAYLLERGARLSVVRRFLNVALTIRQRELFDRLQEDATWIEQTGHSIVVAASKVASGFDEEISSVAHRLRDALAPEALFVLVGIHDDVQLVARSASGSVDVSTVAKALGGGGHARAAAAMITQRDVASVREQVMRLLPQAVGPVATVAQIMSFGVQTVPVDMPVEEAARQMRRAGHEGFPVIEGETRTLVGLLTRRLVDRALSHGMERLPVGRIMKAGVVTVTPTDSIERLQQLMLEEGWGQVPVVEKGQHDDGSDASLLGIVTRTDVLNHLFKRPPEQQEKDVRYLLRELLSPALLRMVEQVRLHAVELQMPLYFVGGLVRDILLRIPATDLDMVVEGDAIKLVRRLQVEFGGDTRTHSRFGTGKWLLDVEVWNRVAGDVPVDSVPATIDFVTARSEFYTEPTALPEIERGSIKLDLHRRDFTVNTLAVRLDGPHFGELLDFYGGRRDLDNQTVRVLHSLSFVDDPTRILRAIRLEQRLSFQIEERTAELIRGALPLLDRVSGSRIRHELELALSETVAIKIMGRMSEIGVLAGIHPELDWTSDHARAFLRIAQMRSDPLWQEAFATGPSVFLFFAAWLSPLPQVTQDEVMERLRVRKATRDDVTAIGRVKHLMEKILGNPQPSRVAFALRSYRPRVVAVSFVVCAESPAADLIERFQREWRHVRTAVSGDHLRNTGLKPGPRYTEILDRLLAAKLDGEIHDEESEQELLQQLLR